MVGVNGEQQKTEDQTTEDGGQRTEDRGQKTMSCELDELYSKMELKEQMPKSKAQNSLEQSI